MVFSCCEVLKNTILKNVGERLILNWLYEVIVWYFTSGQSLSKPSWLSNITEMPVAFKSESERQSGAYAVFIFNPMLSVEPRFRMFISDKYYTQSKRL